MKIKNKELLEEFYDNNISNFPGLTLEQVSEICQTPFRYLRKCIEGEDIVEIRLKYLGSFQVFPGRAKNVLFNLKERLKFHKIDPQEYKRVSTKIENFLKLKEEEK